MSWKRPLSKTKEKQLKILNQEHLPHLHRDSWDLENSSTGWASLASAREKPGVPASQAAVINSVPKQSQGPLRATSPGLRTSQNKLTAEENLNGLCTSQVKKLTQSWEATYNLPALLSSPAAARLPHPNSLEPA